MPCLTASSADEGNPVRHPTEVGLGGWEVGCTLTNVRRWYANKNPWKHPKEVASMSAFHVKPSVLSVINIMRCFNVRIRDATQTGNDRFKSHRWKHEIRGRKEAGEPREGQLGRGKAKATLHASSRPWLTRFQPCLPTSCVCFPQTLPRLAFRCQKNVSGRGIGKWHMWICIAAVF